jgi:NitT/TauT family transport system substrate-binding protein
MAKDRIAAAFVLEPYATQLRPTTKVFARPYEAIGPRFLGSACIAGTEWANAHPDLVRRFASAMREASVWGNRNPKQSGIILAKYSNVSERTIATMTRAVYAEALVPAEIQPVLDFMAKNKLIDTTFPAQEMIFSRG